MSKPTVLLGFEWAKRLKCNSDTFSACFAKKGVACEKSFPYIALLAEGNLCGRQGLLGRPFVLEKSLT